MLVEFYFTLSHIFIFTTAKLTKEFTRTKFFNLFYQKRPILSLETRDRGYQLKESYFTLPNSIAVVYHRVRATHEAQ